MAERPTRTDLVFLRRRVKPQVAVPDVAATHTAAPASTPVTPTPTATPTPRATPPASSGLSLGGPRGGAAAATSAPGSRAASGPSSVTGTTRPARPARPTRPAPFPAPDVTDVRELSRDQPVVRLSPRRSAIGTLVVTGGVHAVWESTELVDGAAFSTGQRMGDVVTTSGNRPLVAFDGDEVLVTLRHVRELRRALVVAGDGAWLQVELPGDRRLSVDPAEPGERVALAMLVVDGLLELRRVTLPDTLTPPLVHQRFGYSIPERPGDSAPNGR